ncbi:hypothetical protein ACH4OW_22745 [Streptomyces sp. NPDC017056]|uniref:hypothetical protein n=1 Tax=Streptomyces sp. NPDC017056 TaxID=3364973 RepID=UPI0037A39D7E
MSKTTPLGNLPYPQPADLADIPVHLQSLAEAVDGRTVLRFADAATRDARVTSPVAGMVAWLDNPGRLFHYAAGHWSQVTPAPALRANYDGGTTVSTTYTETLTDAVGDPMPTAFTAPVSGKVIVTVGAYMFVTAAAGASGTPVGYMGATIRQGTTVTLAAADERAALAGGPTRASSTTQFLVTGLTPGGAYTATPCYRASAATTTANYDNRFVRVDPA